MKKTDLSDPQYFHKVVDCQWACPAHTNVPEYIRLIAAGRYTDSYMLNWFSNVFPGVLGRTCDRPCEPACRRGRVEEKPVAICRLKRVAADFKDDISDRLPAIPKQKNGKRIALVGAGPASLTVARDLLPLGYDVVLYEKDRRGGGAMRTQIPAFRLPESVLDEEVDRILDFGVECHFGHPVESMGWLLKQGFDAVFVGSGAPRGRDLDVPGRREAAANIHIGIDWLASVAFEHTQKIGKRVVVLGGGDTAMDCNRTAIRQGAAQVICAYRRDERNMPGSRTEVGNARDEGVQFLWNRQPLEILAGPDGRACGVKMVTTELGPPDAKGRRQPQPIPGSEEVIPADAVIIAFGFRPNPPAWFDRFGIATDNGGRVHAPAKAPIAHQTANPKVFAGGDMVRGADLVVTAVYDGRQAAEGILQYLGV